ncbi:MAG: beta-glucosidase BglX [Bifidobacterium crudilactis]|jgi:beta-glucosidase|uniref:beta-glucosidase BglX n=1 Tax=Bifidobacterium crudilactis TaxID=327277 RepID=UPI003A5C6EAC
MEQSQLTDLLGQMTLDEKIGQLLQITGDFYSDKAEERTGPMTQLGLDEDDLANAGTVLGVTGAEECRKIQTAYMKRNRLHIPTLFMGDVIHGFRTIFPIPLGLASSWDESAAETMARVSAHEASVSGLFVTFSPMVDLVRDARWGRVMESTGEDPYLNGKLAAAMVHGYQGDDLLADTTRVAACVKHFAAYGAAVAGRDYNTVDMSERQLRDMYLPGYKTAIDAGAKLVMTSFNTVDGVPASGNRHLFRDILRREWGFDGVVISDFGAVKEMISHGVAADERDAAKLAIKAGVDIEMMTVCYLRHLKDLIVSGEVPEQVLDESVMRILELKNDLGLFENPLRGADAEAERTVVMSKQHRDAARRVAEESMVLLKNDDATLPLDASRKIALLGPAAKSTDLLGAWSWKGQEDDVAALDVSLREAGIQVSTVDGDFDYLQPSDQAVEEAVRVAKAADVVVLALGEPSYMSGEASSRSDIRLPQAQLDLFKAVAAVNDRIIVTLFNGRPLDLSDIQSAKAIVEAWFPGTEGGRALADVLTGAVNPSAKLTMSFPVSVGQVPIYYNVDNTGRPYENDPEGKYVSKYLDVSNYAAYPFGFGLSYSKFEYGEVKVEDHEFDADNPLKVSVELRNVSEREGTEIVQCYVHDLVGEVVRPIKQLKGYERVTLAAGESRTVTFTITEEDVRYVHADYELDSDPGDFDVMVGPNSRDLSKAIRVHLF